MFFIISKLFSFFISPIGIVMMGLIYAFTTKNRTKARKVVGAILVFLYVFSNPFIVNEMLLAWEVPATAVSAVKNHDIGIILTGGITNDDKLPLENVFLHYSADRVGQALHLYKAGKINKILISGGSGNLFGGSPKQEADDVAKFLMIGGVPSNKIFIERFSANTRQNAQNSAKILKNQFPNQTYILITSAFHLKRAKACFDKVGIKTTPFGSDYASHERQFFIAYLFPKEECLNLTYWIFREWVGFVAYKIVGYI